MPQALVTAVVLRPVALVDPVRVAQAPQFRTDFVRSSPAVGGPEA